MYTIYQGYAFPISISSDCALDIENSYLYCEKSRTAVKLGSPSTDTQEEGTWRYLVVLGEATTQAMPEGIYQLELRTIGGYMARCIKEFAKAESSAYTVINH